MDKELEELFNSIFVDRKFSKKSINADEVLEEQDIEELHTIGKQSYDESCKTLKKLIKGRKTSTIPLLYRKAVFFLAYRLCFEGKKIGAQTKLLKDLGLAHNSFSKWELDPVRYFQEKDFDINTVPSLSLKRFGKKNDTLCKEFVKLSSQVSYSSFIDIFTGLATITTSKPKRGVEYINDYDNNVFNFLLVIRDYAEQFKEVCNKVISDFDSKDNDNKTAYMKEVYKQFEKKLRCNNSSHEMKSKSRGLKNLFDFLEEWEEESNRGNKNLRYAIDIYKYLEERAELDSLQKFESVCEKMSKDVKKEKERAKIGKTLEYSAKFISTLKEYVDSEIGVNYADGMYEKTFNKKYKNNEDESSSTIQQYKPNKYEADAKKSFESSIELAVAYYFYNSFDIYYASSISGVNDENLSSAKEGLKRVSSYSKRLKKVKILHEDFRDVIRNFNQEQTLLYLDSPYIATAEYEVGFTHTDQIDMINLLKTFKGKWIFSCRASVHNQENKGEEIREKMGTMANYLSLFKERGYFVIEIPTQGNLELMITNYEFIHENIREFDAFFYKWSTDNDF